MTDRRGFLKQVAKGLAVVGAGSLVPRLALGEGPSLSTPGLPSGTLDSSILHALPGKRPLVKRTFRPPNYETPVEYFNEPFTPNDAFFVRYHVPNIPGVGTAEWKLEIGGDSVERPLALAFDDLKAYEQVEIAAVCLCSGNRRGLSDPHVPGIQWAHGAMGNARWKGVRLKDVLGKAGVKKEAVEIVMNGSDSAPLTTTPDFVKSLPMWKALDENTLLAYEMNGEPLPHWNGHPVRLVVPGWTATYWMKQIASIQVVSQPFKGFWMATAYRIPKGKFPVVDRFISQETEVNTPITEMVVASLITNVKSGQRFKVGQRVEVKGIAWDGGYGIQVVDVSSDGGQSWRPAQLGKDLGRFSWRQWSHAFKADKKGVYTVMAKASNRLGASQCFDLIFNPAGYHNNVVQRIDLQVA
ncbi:MAG TPA: molybdopterin-dependent oxidoreductase [Anaeromyxobacteraceae bacterium]|nr:molybdopterin-dependent oxidoreductase [Anaeromyxobacteraceae bacterium]